MDGKVALITGAARGQGLAEAELFAREGARVMLTDVLDDAGEQAAATLGEAGFDVRYQHLDVASAGDWQAAIDAAAGAFGPVTVLVNNAGIVTFAGVADATDDEWQRAIAVNQTGVFYGMRAAAPGMIAAGSGAIVNVSSVFGLGGVPGYFAYQTTKGAVVQMTRAAAVDLAGRGIRVNCVCPGLIFTDMTITEPPEMVEANIAMTPLLRGGEASEVAQTVLHLCSDESSYVTGAVIPVDGGYMAR